jgi:hypothetical protein
LIGRLFASLVKTGLAGTSCGMGDVPARSELDRRRQGVLGNSCSPHLVAIAHIRLGNFTHSSMYTCEYMKLWKCEFLSFRKYM